MKDVLDKIISHKKLDVALRKSVTGEDAMLRAAQHAAHGATQGEANSAVRATISMRQSLEQSCGGIIAEFKRRSPSKGWINQGADVESIVQGYRASGAAACSVLTDAEFFGGSLEDLVAARKVASEGDLPQLPLLRKEFIIDPYQILEARVAGADAVLLIAACLSEAQCREFAQVAHSLSLEVLLEIHTEKELSYLNPDIDMLGVNNRNLGTFHTDIENSFRLACVMEERVQGMIRKPLLVSESGISDPKTILELRAAGFKGFLMGETFMKSSDPALELANLMHQLQC